MNKKQLVNALYRESQATGNGVTTTIGQAGEAARMVGWIEQAYEDVQNKHLDWPFLFKQANFTTSLITDIVPAPVDLSLWDTKSFYNADNDMLCVVDYAAYDRSDPVKEGEGLQALVALPDLTLKALPAPTTIETISYDYYSVPHKMEVDADSPSFAEPFHRLIVAKALNYYANNESAQELKVQADEVIRELEKNMYSFYYSKKLDFFNRDVIGDIL